MYRRRISRRSRGEAAVLVVVAAIGCTLLGCSTDSSAPSPDRPCFAVWVPGISIKVIDAATEQPAACGTEGILTAAGYSATLDNYCDFYPENAWLKGAWERPGEYTVSLQKPGYETWHSERIVVTADECHVHTVELEARLERTTASQTR